MSFTIPSSEKCCDLLKPDGQMLLQAITIADQRYDSTRTASISLSATSFPAAA